MGEGDLIYTYMYLLYLRCNLFLGISYISSPSQFKWSKPSPVPVMTPIIVYHYLSIDYPHVALNSKYLPYLKLQFYLEPHHVVPSVCGVRIWKTPIPIQPLCTSRWLYTSDYPPWFFETSWLASCINTYCFLVVFYEFCSFSAEHGKRDCNYPRNEWQQALKGNETRGNYRRANFLIWKGWLYTSLNLSKQSRTTLKPEEQ